MPFGLGAFLVFRSSCLFKLVIVCLYLVSAAALTMAKYANVQLPRGVVPLLVVEPIVHEEWLQDYLNEHPDIGDIKLLKALEQAMHVTCTRKTMQRWLDSHEPITVEPDIAEHELSLIHI